MSNLPVLPVALPLVAAALMLLARRSLNTVRALALGSTFLGLLIALVLVGQVEEQGVLVLEFGGWPGPFGIVFAVDMLGALMVLVTMVVSSATLLFAIFSLDEERQRTFFFPLFQLLLMGVNGSFLTGDLFNLFVWFEVLLISSYALMALGGSPYQLEETFKYLLVNALGSALFLVGIAVIYSLTGTLNMADIARKLQMVEQPALVGIVAVIFMVVFSVKAALFPVYMWLPRAYFAPPTVISGFFGGLLTKVGVYALFRVVSLMFFPLPFVLPTLQFIAGATMLFGVLGALSQWDMKRVLSYHIISQIGYMIMGLGLYSSLALAGAIFYIVHHILVKTSLFLVAAAVDRSRGTTRLKSLGGIVETEAMLTGLFFVAALGLAGIPPLSGFVAKFALVQAGLAQGAYSIVIVSVIVSFLTLFSMMKIFRYAFWSPQETEFTPSTGNGYRLAGIAVLVGLGIALGLGGTVGMTYAQIAAEQLLHPELYIQAVLGEV